jgi:hypothetical protein
MIIQLKQKILHVNEEEEKSEDFSLYVFEFELNECLNNRIFFSELMNII